MQSGKYPLGEMSSRVNVLESVLEKITILLFEQNKPIIKILLKDISNSYNCGLSVKVNGISDGILCNFI